VSRVRIALQTPASVPGFFLRGQGAAGGANATTLKPPPRDLVHFSPTRRQARFLGFSLLAGLAISVGLGAALSLRGAGSGSPLAQIRLDMGAGPGGTWIFTSDQSGWGWTRRGRALVSPSQYGLGNNSIILHLKPAERLRPPFPIALPPRVSLEDADPAAAAMLKGGVAGGGTLASWPIQTRFGWPARCLGYWHEGVHGWGSFSWSGGPVLRSISGGVVVQRGALPFDGMVLA